MNIYSVNAEKIKYSNIDTRDEKLFEYIYDILDNTATMSPHFVNFVKKYSDEYNLYTGTFYTILMNVYILTNFNVLKFYRIVRKLVKRINENVDIIPFEENYTDAWFTLKHYIDILIAFKPHLRAYCTDEQLNHIIKPFHYIIGYLITNIKKNNYFLITLDIMEDVGTEKIYFQKRNKYFFNILDEYMLNNNINKWSINVYKNYTGGHYNRNVLDKIVTTILINKETKNDFAFCDILQKRLPFDKEQNETLDQHFLQLRAANCLKQIIEA